MNINWCRHWNGILNPACRAGVPYLMLGNDPPKTWPCNRAGGGTCIHRSMPTQEEVNIYMDKMNASVARDLEIMKSIPPGASGKMPCPNCRSTIIWYRSPRNGHLSATCQTKNCFAVMQ
jgi:hypothetical protein